MSDKKYLSRCYTVTALSNMHVGSGDESLGLVDNRVQRDVVTNLPCINASGLKGSLREYFTNEWGKENKEITYIFGSESNSKKEEEHKAGAFNFFSGNLLSMPVRSNRKPHYFATSPYILQELLNFAEHIGHELPKEFVKAAETAIGLEIKEKTALVFDGSQEGQLEDFDITIQNQSLDEGSLKTLEGLLGSPLALCKQKTMDEFCNDFHLPLIARNNLENGRSKNLWHEQVVPRQSRFYFFTLEPSEAKHNLEFKPGNPVQIGGNASIGYGFCAIKELVPEESAG
jgi:CRISPR-associated protein Cmr4